MPLSFVVVSLLEDDFIFVTCTNIFLFLKISFFMI